MCQSWHFISHFALHLFSRAITSRLKPHHGALLHRHSSARGPEHLGDTIGQQKASLCPPRSKRTKLSAGAIGGPPSWLTNIPIHKNPRLQCGLNFFFKDFWWFLNWLTTTTVRFLHPRTWGALLGRSTTRWEGSSLERQRRRSRSSGSDGT